ncbi:MAG: hypothetical protein V4850_17705 [Myxococcota bacterium]
MTPKEALDRLRVAPDDAQAWAEIDRLLQRLAARETKEGRYREPALAAVRGKLEDQLLSGDFPEVDAPVAYFATALRWKVRDAVRKAERDARLTEREALKAKEQAEADRLSPEPFGTELVAAIERVFERAVTMRLEHREPLQRALAQMRALNTEPRTLREIVCEDDGLNPTDLLAVGKAVQRAHKSHQRARGTLAAALEWLIEKKEIDPETGEAVRRALGRLKRRQDRATPRVSAAEGKNDAR